MTTKDRIKIVIAEQLGIDIEELTDMDSLATDFGADSLDLVEMIIALEDLFDIDIPDNVSMDLKNINDIDRYINSKINN